eukprot:CAMPEP_0115878648 /NCGR_PEP_ID=MMETSP0287-20121206/26887_1 /TAXON_ID=412157 /ORGANISM="Chrysochromulina rotalis, Strain UIO044" /LENGTH=64 /DNA_ID=CAMNT_0003334281 /DNA_START=358 /DNA_END=548 /DNA_ORIENTATION=-
MPRHAPLPNTLRGSAPAGGRRRRRVAVGATPTTRTVGPPPGLLTAFRQQLIDAPVQVDLTEEDP